VAATLRCTGYNGDTCGCSSVDRVLASEAKGRGFDPRQPHQHFCTLIVICAFSVISASLMALRPLLYTYRRCPYAMRARMALLQAGVAFDAHEIVLRDKPAEMLAISPKGTVPVLLLPDCTVIEESLGVMRWALETHASADVQDMWLTAQTPDNLALVAINDGEFKRHLDRYKYPEKFAGADRDAHRSAAMQGLVHSLENRLAAAPYLGGAQACAADLAIFPFIRQFRAVDEAWFDAQEVRATQRWLHHWLESELFASCMRKLPTGQRVAF
jgi:glutathione S-transferase